MKENYFVTADEQNKQHEYLQKCIPLLQERFGGNPLCYLHSYGCQGNVAEGERLRGWLFAMGFTFVDDPIGADFVLLNTCAIRENAHHRVFGNLGFMVHQKKSNPNMIIGLCGCMTQQEEVAKKLQNSYPYVDIIFGTHAFHLLPELVYRKLTQKKRVIEITPSDGVVAENMPVQRESSFQASVPIMYGCNNFCSYCIVPYVKGRERSRKPQDILDEIHGLIKSGYQEIMLLGQNVNSYGKGLEEPISFAELLRQVNAIPGDFRVRFMTSHPKDATKELIDTIVTCEKVCKHLHLPLQSGSDRVLLQMNRRYTAAQYLELVQYIKEKIPGISLTSDIIVGFPGETYQDFLKTLEMLKKVEYDSLFTFIYSKRAYTKAVQLKDPVSSEEKSRWMGELLALQNEISLKNREKMVGTSRRLLVEGNGKAGDGMMTGRTDTHMVVDFKGDNALLGSFVNVKITRAYRMALIGELI